MVNNKKIISYSLVILVLLLTWLFAYLFNADFEFELGNYFNFFRSSNYYIKAASLLALASFTFALFYELVRMPENYKWSNVILLGIFSVFIGMTYTVVLVLGLFVATGKAL